MTPDNDTGTDIVRNEYFDESIPPMSLSDRAYKRIEAIILSGRLKGGERLNDSKLAKAFSISRGPVRNALARLAEAGLVELIPYRGAFVRAVNLEDILEIYDIRAAIERAGILAACRNMTGEAMKRLEDCVAAMDQCAKRNDAERFFTLNLIFHTQIHEIGGNKRLKELYVRFEREQKLFQHVTVTTVGIAQANHEHHNILRALQAGDCEGAAREMENHVFAAKHRLGQSVEKIKEEYEHIE